VVVRAPVPEPEPEQVVVRALVVLAVVLLGLVVPVPVLVVQALLLAVPVARRAAVRLAIQPPGRTAGGRPGRPDLARQVSYVKPGAQGCARPRGLHPTFLRGSSQQNLPACGPWAAVMLAEAVEAWLLSSASRELSTWRQRAARRLNAHQTDLYGCSERSDINGSAVTRPDL